MKPFQFILVPVILFLLVLFFRRLRHQPVMRILVMVVLVAGLVFSVFPDSTTLIANVLGIGRGTDLVMYLGMLGLFSVSGLLYLRILKLERMITEIVRQKALEE
ncbi:MAG: DUF2304 domain-containing protein [Bacteroidia bacterium]|nr:DUF2304 domain-containing protein [Bacteroidia bacterium]